MAVEWDKETAQEFITEIKVDMFNHRVHWRTSLRPLTPPLPIFRV